MNLTTLKLGAPARAHPGPYDVCCWVGSGLEHVVCNVLVPAAQASITGLLRLVACDPLTQLAPELQQRGPKSTGSPGLGPTARAGGGSHFKALQHEVNKASHRRLHLP